MKKKNRNISAVHQILESAYPVGTKRQRADGTYIKKSDGSWAKVQQGHNATHGSVKTAPHKESPVARDFNTAKSFLTKHNGNHDAAMADAVSQAASEENTGKAQDVARLAYSFGHNLDTLYAKHGKELADSGMWDTVVDAWHEKHAEIKDGLRNEFPNDPRHR